MPEVLEPESTYQVKVSETDGKPMTYTLAVVDDGLLNLTRYKTPNLHKAFYAKQSLGVKTFDLFDQVMGAYAVNTSDVYSIGGGASGDEEDENKKAQRFKPVVTFLGPFNLEAGKSATHDIKCQTMLARLLQQ